MSGSDLCRFSKIYRWFNTYGTGHKIWPVIHKHEGSEKVSCFWKEVSACWWLWGPCCSNLTKSFRMMLHNLVDNGKVVGKNTQVLWIVWLLSTVQERSDTYQWPHESFLCLTAHGLQQRNLFAHSAAASSFTTNDISLSRTLCCNSDTLNGSVENLQNQLRQ
jgi:hypothetical protein